ncbi:hypothetical protein ABPG74_019327 [Tetrahymena malaccensis]
MKRMPDKIIKSKNYSNQQVKKLPAIHLLEVVLNYLYSNYILLRNIKLQKFLLQGIRLGSDVRILQNYKKKLQKVTYAYYGQKVKHQSRISIHHLVDRVVISELDSLKILKKQFIQHEGIAEMYQRKDILSKFKVQLIRKSNLIKAFQVCSLPNYQKTKLGAKLINFLKLAQSNKPNLMINSAILYDMIREQANIFCQQNNIKQANKYFQMEANKLTKLFGQLLNNKNQNVSLEIIQSAIQRIVLAIKNFKIFKDIEVKVQIVEDTTYIQNDNPFDPNINKNTDFNCIKMKLLGGSEKQKKQDQKFEDHTSQLIPDKMIVEQQNYQTINKKNKSQQTYYNQNLNENKPLNQIEGENSIKNKYLNEMSKQISYQANSDEKINEEQQDQFVNLQNKSQEAQSNLNQNQYRISEDKMKIEEKSNSSFYQQLITQIQNIIDLFNLQMDSKKDQLIYDKDNNQICQYDYQIQNYKFKARQEKSNQNENYKIQLKDLITQTNNTQKILLEQDLSFLKSIFKLGDYITSGGEADIFANIEQQVAFRVIKIDDETLTSNLSELHNIKQFQEELYVLDLQTSHLIENKFTKQKYIIHVMEICQSSLASEYLKIKEYSLGQILNITFNCLHFLIQLRQKYIYHSDIKLANILKINDQYKLSDFGASQIININNPYTKTDMYSEYYYPKINRNLPFYHDIYSVAKTIDVSLNKLYTFQNIKKELKQQIQELIQDNKAKSSNMNLNSNMLKQLLKY